MNTKQVSIDYNQSLLWYSFVGESIHTNSVIELLFEQHNLLL